MNTETFWENFLRVVAVIGLIAVLLLGAWGIIQLAFYIPTLFNGSSSPSAPAGETLTVSAPASVTAGQPFNLNWSHQGGSGDYSYSISYACGPAMTIAAPVPTGAFEIVPCGTPFNYINASSSMPLVPVLATSTNQASATFTVTATKLSTGAIAASGTATVSATAPVSPSPTASKPSTTSTQPSTSSPAPSTQYVSSGRTSNLYGYPDLAVRILSASSVSGYATIKFEIANNGTNVTPYGWSFNALLPLNGTYTYPSGPQRALYPGDYIIYTLNYSTGSNNYNSGYPYNYNGGCNNNYYSQYGYTLPYNTGTEPCNYQYGNSGYNYGSPSTISIDVDPYNQVQESTKSDNYASTSYINY